MATKNKSVFDGNKKLRSILFLLTLLFFNGKIALAVEENGIASIEKFIETSRNNQPVKTINLEELITASKDSPKAEAQTIADVNIRNAEISELKKNQLKLVFDVENLMELQSDLVYGLELIKEQEGNKIIVADSKIFSEDKITIEKNQSVHREIIYQSPEYLDGDYLLWLKIKDESGLALSFQSFNVNLAGSGKFIEQSNPCYLTIEGEKDQKYNLAQGVDLKKTEKLFLNCQAKNLTGETITVLPFIEFYQRDFYGKKISEYQANQNEAITFNKDEEKLTKIAIPLPENPQAYDAKIIFKKENEIISNPTIAHFVLSGKSGSIINASLDKNQYAAGEKAQLILLWAGSADTFFQSRTGGSLLANPTFEVEFKDNKGALCNKQSTYETGEFKTILSISLEKACANPVVTIKLVDEGQTLYTKIITTEPEKELGKQAAIIEQAKENDKRVWIIGVLLIGLILALASSTYLRRKKAKDISKTLIFLLIIGASFFATGRAQAATKTLKGAAYYTLAPGATGSNFVRLTNCGFVSTGIPQCTPAITKNCIINAYLVRIGNGSKVGCYQDIVGFTFDIEDRSVNQGSNVTATGSAEGFNVCNNGVTAAIAVNFKNDGNNANLKPVLPATWFSDDRIAHSGSYALSTTGWSCGSYNARFYLAFVHSTGAGGGITYWEDTINYSVNNCCSQTCSTGPGCRASLANGSVASGTCCGGTACYQCASGFTWNRSMCMANPCVSTGAPAVCANTCVGVNCGTDNCGTTYFGTKTDGVCCVPNNAGCAANTCVGSTCNDGCKNIPGTKTDGVCCVPNNPSCTAANTCLGSTCNDGCNNISGTKSGSCLHDSGAICTGLCGKQANLAGCIESCPSDPKCASDAWCSGTTNCGPCNSGTWQEVAP